VFNLENHKKKISKNPFATPENYFEDNEKKALQKIKSLPKENSRKIFYPLIYISGAAAAVFILFFSIQNTTEINQNLNSINLTSSDIPYDYFDDLTIDEVSENITVLDSSNYETIDYLLDEDISLELIAENYSL
jgi:hypothetical protein